MDGSARQSFLWVLFGTFKGGAIFCGVVMPRKVTASETMIGKVIDQQNRFAILTTLLEPLSGREDCFSHELLCATQSLKSTLLLGSLNAKPGL